MVDIQDEQKLAVTGWQIVVNGKRTENIELNGIIEACITLIKTANGCTSGNLRFGIINQNKKQFEEILGLIQKKIGTADIVDAPYDHPDIYAERSGV